jgi:hypothetical protein
MIPAQASCILLALLAVGAAAGAVAPETDGDWRQAQAGYLATWADLSTWETTNPDTRQTEIGLGLVLDGRSGGMRLAFFVARPPGGRARTPGAVGFRVAAGARLSPTLLRTPTIVFTARVPGGKDTLETVKLDLSSAMTVDNPAPGAAITSAVGSMPARDFQTLADARALSAVLLGAPVEFRDNQRAALRDFRDKVFPTKR